MVGVILLVKLVQLFLSLCQRQLSSLCFHSCINIPASIEMITEELEDNEIDDKQRDPNENIKDPATSEDISGINVELKPWSDDEPKM